jgi:hypothetical protein
MTEPLPSSANSPTSAPRPGAQPPALDVDCSDQTLTGEASAVVRVAARLWAARFDRMLAVGTPVRAGTALSVHARRITTVPEREAIARTLRRAIRETTDPLPPLRRSSRLPVHRGNVASAETTIDTITLRLHSPRPITARGMARLRVLLSDGAGPFYQNGRGDLQGRLGAALAAL